MELEFVSILLNNYYFAAGKGVVGIAMRIFDCLFVCPLTSRKPHGRLYQFSVHVTCDRRSALLWRL